MRATKNVNHASAFMLSTPHTRVVQQKVVAPAIVAPQTPLDVSRIA